MIIRKLKSISLFVAHPQFLTQVYRITIFHSFQMERNMIIVIVFLVILKPTEFRRKTVTKIIFLSIWKETETYFSERSGSIHPSIKTRGPPWNPSSDHHSTIVSRGPGGAFNWSPIMPIDAILSENEAASRVHLAKKKFKYKNWIYNFLLIFEPQGLPFGLKQKHKILNSIISRNKLNN